MKYRNMLIFYMIFIFVLGTTVTQADANVFTVDDSGGGNYTTIREAVDKAQNGDTILLNPGVYRENVAVNEELTILSNLSLSTGQTDRTYVIGMVPESDVFDINSNNVTIQGLYIVGGPSSTEQKEVGINLKGVRNCSIINNALVLNDIGISLNNSKSNYLKNNLVSLGEDGIVLVDSNENELSNNTVTTNGNGISLNNSMNNTLTDNVADSNMIGILLGMSEQNMLTYNFITRNINGINGRATKSNLIVNNTLFLNDVGIYLKESADNSIYENKFSNLYNAMDEGRNIWNSSSTGNFWRNYTGQDTDGNGIGDTPYVINQTTESIDYMPVFSVNVSEEI